MGSGKHHLQSTGLWPSPGPVPPSLPFTEVDCILVDQAFHCLAMTRSRLRTLECGHLYTGRDEDMRRLGTYDPHVHSFRVDGGDMRACRHEGAKAAASRG